MSSARKQPTFHDEQAKHFNAPCSGKCGRKRDLSYSRYCRECRNKRSRATRPRPSELLPEAQQRISCRAHTKMLIRRGHLIPQPCEDCGATDLIEAHHDDYAKPREVRWKCRSCHNKHHRPQRSTTCPTCGAPNDRVGLGQVYCRACHNKRMREHRAKLKQELKELRARFGKATATQSERV